VVISDYYQHLKIEYPDDGVLLVTINRPEVGNRANARLHWELGQIWLDVSSDPDTRVAVITGAGDAFCGGGELQKFLDQINDFPKIAQLIKEAKDIVQNMANCEKPIISAINGMANGVGAAVGLSADISIAGENALISDGHIRMGIAAGDHGALIWPLKCGLAKSAYYLLSGDSLTGREAERIGLVGKCVPDSEVLGAALELAANLASGPQHAIRWTKRALSQWLRVNMPIFESSLAFEMLNFFDGDVLAAATAAKAGRKPVFPSANPNSSKES
jgi:enoyl-CoA hydratase/carnithine racemase